MILLVVILLNAPVIYLVYTMISHMVQIRESRLAWSTDISRFHAIFVQSLSDAQTGDPSRYRADVDLMWSLLESLNQDQQALQRTSGGMERLHRYEQMSVCVGNVAGFLEWATETKHPEKVQPPRDVIDCINTTASSKF